MSNILYIEKTKFVRNDYTSYGLCIYDDYEKDYDNNLSEDEFNSLIDGKDIFNLAKELFPDFNLETDYFSAIKIDGEDYSIEELEDDEV